MVLKQAPFRSEQGKNGPNPEIQETQRKPET
jgi:hypothetical protein